MTHVYPVNDVKPHNTEALDCDCAPRIDWDEHVVTHNSWDGRERRERQSDAMIRAGADILGEISATQRLLEVGDTVSSGCRPALQTAWRELCKNYADGKFKQARLLYGPIRSLASAVLVDIPKDIREIFLNDLFALGYVGWVNCMDERLEGGS